MTDGFPPTGANETSGTAANSRHANHCFIVMPFGRTSDEERWFRGWYQAVIEPAVTSSGFEPILSASEDHPSAINDEIRSHLVFDPMVIVDLGGMHPDDPPNPNVMYELGIRHAFGLPLVLMAWEGQRLPFDVNNQRAIMARRDFIEIEPTRQKLIRFLKAAQQGRYYNPMESVGREAAIEATSLVLGEESLLGALANEVRELRGVVTARQMDRETRLKRQRTIKTALTKADRSALWNVAQQIGLDAGLWSKFLATPLAPDRREEMQSWSVEEWINFLKAKSSDLLADLRAKRSMAHSNDVPPHQELSDEFLESVTILMPEQPWPTSIHKDVADKLEVPAKKVSAAIQELIRRGRFFPQVDGVVLGSLVEPIRES